MLNVFAFDNNLAICRKTWEQFKAQANWREIAERALEQKAVNNVNNSFIQKAKNQLAKINFLF